MILSIIDSVGSEWERECSEFSRQGAWLILYESKEGSGVDPLPKVREVISFYAPASVALVLEDEDEGDTG